jgi:hypothetical protein
VRSPFAAASEKGAYRKPDIDILLSDNDFFRYRFNNLPFVLKRQIGPTLIEKEEVAKNLGISSSTVDN